MWDRLCSLKSITILSVHGPATEVLVESWGWVDNTL